MFPLKVSFRQMKSSEAIERRIYQEAEKLDKLFDRIHSCDVVVSIPHRAHSQGKIFHINISLSVPGKVLAVTHEPEENHAHEDAFVAVRDAFRSMEHELSHYANKRKNKKQHRAGLKNTIQMEAANALAMESYEEGNSFSM